MLEWVKNRLKERTSWDGVALMAAGVPVLFDAFVWYVALGAIAWGAWTFYKKEQ